MSAVTDLLSKYGGAGAKPLSPKDEDDGNIISNFFGDIGELATGLGQLGGAIVGDVGRGLAETFTLGNYTGGEDRPQGTFNLDDIAKNLTGIGHDPVTGKPLQSAVLQDLTHRYGPLFRGDLGEFAQRVEEDPGFFLLDALGLGSVASKVGGKVAKQAIRGTPGQAVATRVGRELLASGVPARKAYPAALREGLESLTTESGELPGLLSLSRRTLPKAGQKLVSDTLETYVPHQNPVRRLLFDTPYKRLTTQSVDDLERGVGDIAGQIADYALEGRKAPATLVAEQSRLAGILKDAKAAGLTRIEKPQIAKLNAYLGAKKMLAKLGADHLLNREKAMARYANVIRPYVAEDPTISDTFHLTATALDVDVPGYQAVEWVKKPFFQKAAVREALPVKVPVGAARFAPPPLPAVLDDATRGAAQLADPAFLERTERVAGSIKSFTDRMEGERQVLSANAWDVDAEIAGAERLLSGVYDGLKRRIAHERGEAPLPAAVRMQDDIRLANLEDLAPRFGSLGFTPRQAWERAYVPLRMKYGAKFDDISGDLMGGPAIAELDDTLRASGLAQPVYFPYIDPAVSGTWDFFRSKKRIGANISAKDPHMKKLRGVLLKDARYSTDPLEVYTRRAARAVREEETFTLINSTVRATGRPISSVEEVPPGYVIFAPDLAFITRRTKRIVEDTLDDLVSQGIDNDTVLRDTLNKTIIQNQDDLTRVLGVPEGTPGSPKMWAVPKVVADRLDDAAKWASLSGKNIRLFWDTPIAAWRAMVLTGSPRWLVNNILGDQMFAMMQGTKTLDVMRILGQRFKKMANERFGTTFKTPLLDDLARIPGFEDVGQGFVGSASMSYNPRLGPGAAATRTGRLIERGRQSKVSTIARTWSEFMRRVNSETDLAYRQAGFLTAAERQAGLSSIQRTARSFWKSKKRVDDILRRGIDETSVASLLEEVNMFYGNYAAMGPFERHVVRRFLFPFWGWYRHVIRLAGAFPGEFPGRAQALRQLTAVTEEMMEQHGPMPEWLEGAVPMGPGAIPGDTTFLSTRGMNPFSLIAELAKDPARAIGSSANPLLKVGIEQWTERNTFTGQPYSDLDVVTPFGTDQPFRILKDDEGNVIGMEPTDEPTPNLIEHLLQTIPQYEMAKELAGGGVTYDTSGLLEVLSGEGVRRGPDGEPLYPTDALQELGGFFGHRTYDFNVDEYQAELAEQQQAALRQALQRGAPAQSTSGSAVASLLSKYA